MATNVDDVKSSPLSQVEYYALVFVTFMMSSVTVVEGFYNKSIEAWLMFGLLHWGLSVSILAPLTANWDNHPGFWNKMNKTLSFTILGCLFFGGIGISKWMAVWIP